MMDTLALSGFLCVTLLTAVLEASIIVEIEPLYHTVRYGQTMTQNCSTNCQAISLMGFEIKESNFSKTKGSGWISITYVVKSWNLTPTCFVNCQDGRRQQSSTKSYIRVFDFPEKVIINPLPVMQVNKTYDLTCTVPNVAPVQNLKIKIWNGNRVVLKEAYPNDTLKEHQNKTVIYTFTPEIADDGVEYTCSAELDLGPNSTYINTTSSVTLSVFAFPEKPKIIVEDVIEANKESTVRCEVADAFPFLKTRIILMHGERELKGNIANTSHQVTAEATFHASSGKQWVICKATLEYETKEENKSVIGYVLPEPVITLHEVEAGYTAGINCSVTGEKPEDVIISLKHENGTLLEPAVYNFVASKKDNGSKYICETKVEVKGRTFRKSATQTLTVTYAPEINKTATSHRAMEGSSATLTCKATGNPFPQITWTKNGVNVGNGETLTIAYVSKNSTGAYHCGATNSKGTDNHTINFITEYSPSTPTIKKKPEKIRKGDNITMLCNADSSPQATYSWLYTPSINVNISKDNTTIHISNASETNTGSYTCEARNEHGNNTASVQINVLFPPEISTVTQPKMIWKGDTVNFVCNAISNPPPTYLWLYPPSDNVNTSHEGTKIHINKAKPKNAGNYSCEVQNELGKNTRNIWIVVHYSPEMPHITVSPETIYEGSNVTINCSTDSYPPATYSWSYPSSATVYISDDNRTISIMGATQQHSGNYTCNVKNKHGSHITMKPIYVHK